MKPNEDILQKLWVPTTPRIVYNDFKTFMKGKSWICNLHERIRRVSFIGCAWHCRTGALDHNHKQADRNKEESSQWGIFHVIRTFAIISKFFGFVTKVRKLTDEIFFWKYLLRNFSLIHCEHYRVNN